MTLNLKEPLYEQLTKASTLTIKEKQETYALILFDEAQNMKCECLIEPNLELMPHFFKYDLECFSPLEILSLHHLAPTHDSLTLEPNKIVHVYSNTCKEPLVTLIFSFIKFQNS